MKSLSIFILLGFVFLVSPAFSQDTPEGIEGELKKEQYQLTEVVKLDSVPATELLKRAVNWVKEENTRYIKSNGVTAGSRAEFVAVFKIKVKELNPHPDFTGTIVMHVSVECKDNKYKYTITKVKHISANGTASGGDVSNVVPDCGSMTMSDIVWKKIKGEASKHANEVMYEIKAVMAKPAVDKKDDW